MYDVYVRYVCVYDACVHVCMTMYVCMYLYVVCMYVCVHICTQESKITRNAENKTVGDVQIPRE